MLGFSKSMLNSRLVILFLREFAFAENKTSWDFAVLSGFPFSLDLVNLSSFKSLLFILSVNSCKLDVVASVDDKIGNFVGADVGILVVRLLSMVCGMVAETYFLVWVGELMLCCWLGVVDCFPSNCFCCSECTCLMNCGLIVWGIGSVSCDCFVVLDSDCSEGFWCLSIDVFAAVSSAVYLASLVCLEACSLYVQLKNARYLC